MNFAQKRTTSSVHILRTPSKLKEIFFRQIRRLIVSSEILQNTGERTDTVFDRIHAQIFAFGMETGTGRRYAVNDGHTNLSDSIGIGTAAGIDPSGFVAFFLGSTIDHFNEFLGGVRAGHSRGLGNTRGFDRDAVAPILLGQRFDTFVNFAAVFVIPAAGVDLKGALFRNRVADRTASITPTVTLVPLPSRSWRLVMAIVR